MNKLLSSVFLFIISFSCVFADSSESSESSEVLNALEERLRSVIAFDFDELSRRVDQHCPDVERRLNETLDEVIGCATSLELGDETLCSLVRNNLERCLNPITRLIEGCLPASSRRIPTLVIRILTAFVDQSCNSTVEEFLELFNPCDTSVNITSISSCNRVIDALEGYQSRVPTTSGVCTTLTTLRSCFASHRERACRNPVTRRADENSVEAIFNATRGECQRANEIN